MQKAKVKKANGLIYPSIWGGYYSSDKYINLYAALDAIGQFESNSEICK